MRWRGWPHLYGLRFTGPLPIPILGSWSEKDRYSTGTGKYIQDKDPSSSRHLPHTHSHPEEATRASGPE